MSGPTGRHWFGVIHATDNTDLEDVDRALTLAGTAGSSFRYAIWQFEVGEETAQLHIQLYLQLLRPARRTGVQSALKAPDAHLEIVQNDAAAKAYSSKSDTRVCGPFEAGAETSQGSREDLQRARDLVLDTRSLRDLAHRDISAFAKYTKAWDRLLNLHRPNQFLGKREFIIHWGCAGAGKSYYARSHCYGRYHVSDVAEIVAGNNGVWFDGCDNPKCIFIDDFRGAANLHIQILKLITDPSGYPTQVETKHGRVWICPELVIITSETDPKAWYPRGEWMGLQRRVTQLRHWTTPRADEPEFDTTVGWVRRGLTVVEPITID